MRHLILALAVLGCSSGNKQPVNPTPPDPGTDPGTGEPGGGLAAQPEPPAPPPPPPPDTGGFKLVAPSSLKWGPLDPNNPGPEIAWVTGDAASGGGAFLKLPPGTKPGFHTHTADYHAVVVSGAPKHWLPGEDKKAKPLGVGSYWFQPGNQPHADECTGTEACVLYLVVAGALDFAPAPKAKPGKPGKYSLVGRAGLKFNLLDPKQAAGPKMALVSGDPKKGPLAAILELPPGFNSGLHSHTSEYHALVLEGEPAHWLPHERSEGEPVAPGTYWFQPGGYDHGDRCPGTAPCRLFVMMPGAFDFKPAAQK